MESSESPIQTTKGAAAKSKAPRKPKQTTSVLKQSKPSHSSTILYLYYAFHYVMYLCCLGIFCRISSWILFWKQIHCWVWQCPSHPLSPFVFSIFEFLLLGDFRLLYITVLLFSLGSAFILLLESLLRMPLIPLSLFLSFLLSKLRCLYPHISYFLS